MLDSGECKGTSSGGRDRHLVQRSMRAAGQLRVGFLGPVSVWWHLVPRMHSGICWAVVYGAGGRLGYNSSGSNKMWQFGLLVAPEARVLFGEKCGLSSKDSGSP